MTGVDTGWLPIKTAPKDGTKVILHKDGNAFAPCEWSKAGDISENGFCVWWQSEPEWLTEIILPTHWMPLPKEPNND